MQPVHLNYTSKSTLFRLVKQEKYAILHEEASDRSLNKQNELWQELALHFASLTRTEPIPSHSEIQKLWLQIKQLAVLSKSTTLDRDICEWIATEGISTHDIQLEAEEAADEESMERSPSATPSPNSTRAEKRRSSSKPKRERSSNLTNKERHYIANMVESPRFRFLLDKRVNKEINLKKRKGWAEIAKEFTRKFNNPRNGEQILNAYKNAIRYNLLNREKLDKGSYDDLGLQVKQEQETAVFEIQPASTELDERARKILRQIMSQPRFRGLCRNETFPKADWNDVAETFNLLSNRKRHMDTVDTEQLRELWMEMGGGGGGDVEDDEVDEEGPPLVNETSLEQEDGVDEDQDPFMETSQEEEEAPQESASAPAPATTLEQQFRRLVDARVRKIELEMSQMREIHELKIALLRKSLNE